MDLTKVNTTTVTTFFKSLASRHLVSQINELLETRMGPGNVYLDILLRHRAADEMIEAIQRESLWFIGLTPDSPEARTAPWPLVDHYRLIARLVVQNVSAFKELGIERHTAEEAHESLCNAHESVSIKCIIPVLFIYV